jgi:hypothetical protein
MKTADKPLLNKANFFLPYKSPNIENIKPSIDETKIDKVNKAPMNKGE